MIVLATTQKKTNDLEVRVASASLMISVFGFPDISSITYATRIFFVATFLFYCFKNSKSIELNYFMWMIVTSLYGLVNCIFSYDQPSSFKIYFTLLQAIGIGFLLYNWMRLTKRYNEILLSIIAGGVILCVRLSHYINFYNWGGRKVGTMLGINVNSLGLRIAICFVFVLALVVMYNKKKWLKIIGMSFCFIFVAFVLITGSRRALIICFISFLIIMLGHAKDIVKTLKALIIITAVVFIIVVLISNTPQLYNVIGKRLEFFLTALYYGGNYLDDGRDDMIKAALNLFWQHPLLGWGMGTFSMASGFSLSYAHNTFAELLFAMGLPGFCIYYYIYLVVFFKSLKLQKKNINRILVTALLATSIISDSAAVNYSTIISHILIAMMMAISEFDQWNEVS